MTESVVGPRYYGWRNRRGDTDTNVKTLLDVYVNGVKAATYDSSGNITAVGNITAGGTVIQGGAITGDVAITGALSVSTTLSVTGRTRLSGIVVEKATPVALTGTATVTAAQILSAAGGIIDGTPVAAATYTLPTAALLVAAVPGAAVGDSFMFVVNNKSGGANTITVAAGANGTLYGTATIAQNIVRVFVVVLTNVTGASETYVVYSASA